jgi:hypothetical protein
MAGGLAAHVRLPTGAAYDVRSERGTWPTVWSSAAYKAGWRGGVSYPYRFQTIASLLPTRSKTFNCYLSVLRTGPSQRVAGTLNFDLYRRFRKPSRIGEWMIAITTIT